MIKLGNYIKLIGGGTPSKKNNSYWGGDVPWMSVKDLKSDYVNKTIDSITQIGVNKSTTSVIPSGSLIIATRMAVGKVVITEIETAINQDLKGIRIIGDIDQKYLFFLLKSKRSHFESISTGATVKGIKLNAITDLQIPLPPLAQQKKIASILDAADVYRQKTKSVIEKYDALTQSLFLDMFGDPVTNSKLLSKIKLGALGKWQSGGTPSRSNSKYFGGNIPWLSSGELNQMYTSESQEYITDQALKESNTKLIEKGSILLGMYDTAALKSTINTDVLTCNQAIAYCKLNEAIVNTSFVYHIIQIGRNHYRRLQRGVRQKNLNLTMVKEIEILLPSITLQNKFAERVQFIDIQKEKAQASLAKAEDLYNSLLQKAFNGELVS